jgi:hypothetical protein
LDGPAGAASALKLLHSGVMKGMRAVGAAAFLAASEHGLERTLLDQLADGQPELAAWLGKHMPALWERAYRSGAEMHEMEGFVDQDTPSRDLYAAIAEMYGYLERALTENGEPYQRLSRAFLNRSTV